MPDFDPNAGSLPPKDETAGAASMSHLPPSNVEIKIRTMETDIESVRRGGGLLGLSEKISISMPAEGTAPGVNVPASAGGGPKKKIGVYIIIGVVVIAALFAAGYFLPILIASRKGVPVAPPSAEVPPAATAPAPAPAETALVHASYFKIPADSTVTALIDPSVMQPLDSWFANVRTATSGFSEILATSKTGETYTWTNFLATLNLPTLSGQFFSENFEPDFTAFVYRDAAGFWPGFVLKIKPNESPLLLSAGVAKLETDTALVYSFFSQAPGSAAGSFADAQVSGSPVRELVFSAKPSAFIYGWIKNQYLVIGTSEDAIKAAVSRL